jgi:predicted transcriptional regulator
VTKELSDREAAVLEAIAAADAPMYKKEIAETVEVPYSTTATIVDTLTDDGLLRAQSALCEQSNGATALLTVYRGTGDGRDLLANDRKTEG